MITRQDFRKIAGEVAKTELNPYEADVKGWLMLLLVNYTERLEKALWGAENGKNDNS